MKHKTAELTGALLDAAVAKAEGADVKFKDGEITHLFWPRTPGRICYAEWRPSMGWAQGGPIIEQERIGIWVEGGVWNASKDIDSAGGTPEGWGNSPLIAAMRAYVAHKLGEEVELCTS